MRIFRKRQVAVLANPYSGMNTSRAGLATVIGAYLATPRWCYAPDTLTKLDAAAAEIVRRCPDVVAVAGGDGMAHQALTRLIREHADQPGYPMPQILILPTGTMNNVATTLGLMHRPADQLAQRIATKISSGAPLDTAHLAPMRVGDEFGFMYGAGLPVTILRRYNEAGAGGPRTVVKTVLRLILNEVLTTATFGRCRQSLFPPVPSQVEVFEKGESRVFPYSAYTAILAGTIETCGVGCRALPLARQDPHEFMVRASALNFWGVAALLGPLWAGMPLPWTHDARTAQTRVTYETPMVAMLDGDFLEPSRSVDISTGPLLTFVTG